LAVSQYFSGLIIAGHICAFDKNFCFVTADIVRSLLLAGIRSAYLWRQLGGRRWKLAFQRQSMLRSAQELSRGLDVL
jgi:CII-binding regulator of phage lambda lysogenization HflD